MTTHEFLAFAFSCGLAIQVAATAEAEQLAPGLTLVDDYTIVGEENFLKDFAPRNADGTINVIVEIPTGTVAKWEVMKPDGDLRWEFKNGAPREVKFLGYPGNYGMLPRTLHAEARGGDGDPLDVLVLGKAVPRGSVVTAKVIGVLKLLDGGEQDDKILAVLQSSPLAEVDDPNRMKEKFPGVLSIVEIWFESYKGPGEIVSDGYSYQVLMIMTHRDRFWFVSGRKQAADNSGGDVGHRQGLLTPSETLQKRPERRTFRTFGRRRPRLAHRQRQGPRIAAPRAPCRKI